MANDLAYGQNLQYIHLERTDGVLEMRLHYEDGPLKVVHGFHSEWAQALADIARDPENKVVILTGTGDVFCHHLDYTTFTNSAALGGAKSSAGDENDRWWHSAATMENLLAVPCPMIGAINGPARVHAEFGLLCDVVLASQDAVFQDAPHFANGVVPGDGVHVVWPLLLGPNRGRYFLLTSQTLAAREAFDLGIVNEIMPLGELMPRARELAHEIARRPMSVLRSTRELLTAEIRRRAERNLRYGLQLERASHAEFPGWRMHPLTDSGDDYEAWGFARSKGRVGAR
jgi:6-oxocamphor hydrolase